MKEKLLVNFKLLNNKREKQIILMFIVLFLLTYLTHKMNMDLTHTCDPYPFGKSEINVLGIFIISDI